jgi:hypothetical protein
MTIAVSVRLKRWSRQVAQKVIISHIQNYVACLKWETALIEDPRYYPVPLPTHEDYNHLVRDIEETGELQIVSGGDDEKWILVPTLNVIRSSICFEGKDLVLESRRPEDEGKENVPDVAYFVVDKSVLSDGRRFKSRKNFGRLLDDARVMFFDITNPQFNEAWIKEEVKKHRALRQTYKASGMPEKEVQKWVRKQGKGDRKANNPSLTPTPRRLLRKEFYAGKRKNFDKKIERLRKMGFWL